MIPVGCLILSSFLSQSILLGEFRILPSIPVTPAQGRTTSKRNDPMRVLTIPLLFARQARWVREVKAAKEKVAAEAAEPIPVPKGNKKVQSLEAFCQYRMVHF